MKTFRVLLTTAALGAAATAAAAPATLDDAAVFGARDVIDSASLSADGKKLVYVGAGTESSTIAVVVDLEKGSAAQVARADGNPINLTGCEWTARDRIVCQLYGMERPQGVILPIVRTMSMDADGKKQIFLGVKQTLSQLGKLLQDGRVIDWLDGSDGKVLMSRYYVPENSTGRLTARSEHGLGVDLIDTRTGKATTVERAGRDVDLYMSDGAGHVRLMTTTYMQESGYSTGIETHSYRTPDDRTWRKLGTFTPDRTRGGRGTGMIPLAVDGKLNAAYVLENLDGRMALYRVTLDESPKHELVLARKDVDVDDVIRIGRGGRVIGATYVTDRRYVEYFDPDYKKLHEMLSRAIPRLPLIDFMSASADEQMLVVRASSDVDPGNWYIYDRSKKSLALISPTRPALAGRTLSPVKAVSYPAADGTRIPAYLTLPPGVTEARNLPALVMPHGGPGARDEWGFDWLAQYFAQRGFAVLQPNFRGSNGYGDAWFADNGFRGWKTSVGDVCDAGRWMIQQGMAAPDKLAVFGWSYGGYAALQANVLDATLFKAVIAVAPVTDLDLLKDKGMIYTSGFVDADFIGNGPHVKEGSPAEHAGLFKAPVLMFHGDIDLNVDIGQSRRMDRQLHRADKSSELIVYPKLEHSLLDGSVRADMLRRSDAFLRDKLRL
ncbi:MAG TPA: alpha/beta fold hydrolase [Steroidobacteraceae bacterium]|nr:alpha/beta fold hydrolase [Steroidobacteraceae bacterium]